MKLFYRFERQFNKLGISNITLYLIGGQVLAFVLLYLHPEYYNLMILRGSDVLSGEFWKLITFLFTPVALDPFFMLLMGLMFYSFGTALEQRWGSFHYFLYLFVEYILILVAAMIFPSSTFTNTYLLGSIFLAFAYLYPDAKIYLFFILPLKMRWVGIAIWCFILFSFVVSSLVDRILIIISVFSFFIFFGKDIMINFRYKGVPRKSAKVNSSAKPFHVCAICGKNEIQNPDMEIRYCKKCIPETCYCGEHIFAHEHLMN